METLKYKLMHICTYSIVSSKSAQQNLVYQDPTQEKGTMTLQETVWDLPVGVRQFPAKIWVGGGLLQG